MRTLRHELGTLLDLNPELGSIRTRGQFVIKLREGNLSRYHDALSHFCVFLVLIRTGETGIETLIGWHRKAQKFLPPGGHIDYLEDLDRDELMLECAGRELEEEVGADITKVTMLQGLPFWITFTPISSSNQLCIQHYDIWYCFDVTGLPLSICREFEFTEWHTIKVALTKFVDPSVLEAFKKLDSIIA